MTHHAAEGGCRNRPCHVHVKFVVGALRGLDWTWTQDTTQRHNTPQERAPIWRSCCRFVEILSKDKIIWPVMASACGSLHTVVTFVPNG
jgi:hypothetical protein